MMTLPTEEEINRFLQEDIGGGDITATIIPENTCAKATVICREHAVICGQSWFNAVFKQLDDNISINWQISEGEKVDENTVLCELEGSARHLLTGERTALNLLQTLSATATVARAYADAVSGTGCKVLDTRKTIPGLRMAQKYAVRCGGCFNHRIGLFDAVLIKENHIIAAGSIEKAILTARAYTDKMVEIEVESLTEFEQALVAKPDRILLDNFAITDLKRAVDINNGNLALEASGNITLENIRQVAETGVDYISIGALTKNIQATDLSMRIKLDNES